MTGHLQFIELPPFSRKRDDHLNDEEFASLQARLTADPEAGDVLNGTGGVRKVRVQSHGRNKGKSGGARIIYLFRGRSGRIYLFDIVDKAKKTNITKGEANEIEALVSLLD